MRPLTSILIACLLLYYILGCSQNNDKGTAEWLIDFEKAKDKASVEQKPILLNFTGSDWCGWCIKLNEEVFSQSEFIKYASANLILVKLDFPKENYLSEKINLQNESLAKKYSIRGFPTILLLSPEAELIEITGYVKGGVINYIDHIDTLLQPSG